MHSGVPTPSENNSRKHNHQKREDQRQRPKIVDPSGERLLNRPGSADNRIMRTAIAEIQPDRIDTVVADVESDKDQQPTTSTIDIGQQPPRPPGEPRSSQ